MIADLTDEERTYLENLLNDRARGIRSLSITANLLLVFGGVLIIGTILYLAQQMTDVAAYSVGLPNFIGGLLLIAGSMALSRRAAHIRRLTSILSKLASVQVEVRPKARPATEKAF